MSATAIDSLPGALLDVLLATQESLPGLKEFSAGRARGAAGALRAHSESPVAAAWHYVAEHAALLALPDGGALPYQDHVDARPPWPRHPDLPPEGSDDYGICWVLTQLCVGMRDLRGMLPPLTNQEVSPVEQLWQAGEGVLRHGRRVVAPAWPALRPHIDLLGADLASRAGRRSEASALIADARFGFRDAGDSRGVAAVATVTGDWEAAPFASPVTWGFALGRATSEDSALPSSIEEREQACPPDAARAAAAYDEADALYLDAGDMRGQAVVAWRRAYLQLVTGRPDLATQQARSATRMLAAAGDDASALLADAHAVLAGLADGRMPVAAEAAAPVVAWGTGDGSLSYAIGIGVLFARAGRHWMVADRRPERSLAAFGIAEAIWAGLGRPVSRSQTLADQAHALSALGARQAALIYLVKAIDADGTPMREPADPLDVRRQRAVLLAADLYNLANAVSDTEGMARAQRQLQLAADPLRERRADVTPEQAAVADQLIDLVDTLAQKVIGLVYLAQQAREEGDDATAAQLFGDAEDALAQADPGQAGQLAAIIRAYQLRFDEAAAAYRPWLAARLAEIEDARPSATSSVAATLLRQAERQLRDQALMFSVRTRDIHTAHEQLAVLQSQADPWWADLGTAWEHEDVVGRLLELDSDLDTAAATFARAVEAVEVVRAELRRDDLKQAFGADRTVQQVYRNAARVELRRREIAVAQGAMATAAHHGAVGLRLLELARSRALADLMAHPNPGLPSAVVDAWRGAGAELALCQDRLAAALAADPADPARVAARSAEFAAAQRELDAREAQLRTLDPRFWQLAAVSSAAPDPAVVLTQLPGGHAVLMYSLDSPDLLACGLTSSGMVAASWSREERRVDRLAGELVAACSAGRPWERLATNLAAILLEPLAAALDGATTVHVIASGATLRVPFAVLPWRGRPLGQQVALTALPNLAAYPLLTPDGSAGAALVIGNPSRMQYRRTSGDETQPLRSLPAAAVEAAAVARVLGGTALIGADATETRTRAELPAARVVHLATHGVLDLESPLASAVVLAEGEQLTVAELHGMRLQADLIVLSACQTGTGEVAGGDELLGLGRALLAAGARSAVVTLWPVDDVSAAVVMTRFHALRAQGIPAAQALREATGWLSTLGADQAQGAFDTLRAEVLPMLPAESWNVVDSAARAISATAPTATPYAHPLHWAPYVLVGR
ncbi:MAG: CHAT domain-containing protein [Pseudonocardiaceae bacterium]